MSTKTRTPLEKLPYDIAIKRAEDALTPFLGRNIGKGWIYNGGDSYVTKKGKLLFNLTIQPAQYMNPVEEAELFHDTGIDTVMDFLEKVGLMGTAHFVVRQDEATLGEKLRAL